MKNKVIIPIVMVTIIVAIGGVFISINNSKQLIDNTDSQTSNQIEEIKNEEDLEVEGQGYVEEKENEVQVDASNDSSSSTTEKKEEVKKNVKSSKSNSRNTATNSGNNSDNTSSSVQSNQESNNNTNNDVVEQPKEEPKKQTPWEALGVSEYHYYNEPMYSWERIDFPVSKYGSEANCRKACAEYGDHYEPYINGEVSYSCSIVTSLSGKYLGEFFSTEKLN